ncbi:hypothetical protein X777_00480 [Ooceraea biroi]|uniref:Uncharacterized protein n=1 Tax=Ooceraea biroi TaxID=2015173 RepID=A0A026WTV7_OOCBI|nr:hypothetical protein X777_00480 [Ooceraea biroi]
MPRVDGNSVAGRFRIELPPKDRDRSSASDCLPSPLISSKTNGQRSTVAVNGDEGCRDSEQRLAVSHHGAALSVATAAPSGYLGHGLGAALAGPILGPAALAGPANGPSVLAGPVVGPARISGAVDGGAVVTGSVAGPSLVSGSVAGHTGVVGPAFGYAAPGLGWPAYGGLGAVLAGPAVGPAALSGPIAAPALIAGPSGSIAAGHGGLGGIIRGYAPGHW